MPASEPLMQERATAQARSSVWGDGKRRVTVAQFTRLLVGQQIVTKRTDQVIDDPILIAMLEKADVELIDLDVNGRPAFTRTQVKKTDDERIARIDALAKTLEVIPTALHEALNNGSHASLKAVRDAIEERFKSKPPPVAEAAKPGPTSAELAGGSK